MLEEMVGDVSGIKIIERVPGATRIHYIRYPILTPNKKLRNRIISELRRTGIESSSMYAEDGMKIDSKQFPGAGEVLDKILTLPCHPKVSHDDILIMAKIIKKVCEEG